MTHEVAIRSTESRVNDLCRVDGDAVICTYRLQFSGDTVIDTMRTYPLVIIGGVLHQNPFFITPEQFLPDFRERQAKQTVRNQTV
jgi:hypothetical protein